MTPTAQEIARTVNQAANSLYLRKVAKGKGWDLDTLRQHILGFVTSGEQISIAAYLDKIPSKVIRHDFSQYNKQAEQESLPTLEEQEQVCKDLWGDKPSEEESPKFEVGKAYYYGDSADGDKMTVRYIVTKRTAKTVWLQSVDRERKPNGKVFSKRVQQWDDGEAFMMGNYSMAPCLRAKRVCTEEVNKAQAVYDKNYATGGIPPKQN